MAGTEEEQFTNILNNAVAPVDVRKMSQVFGVAEYVAAEVMVSYLARWVFKIEKRTIMELVAIHAVSVPFIGGLAAYADPNHPLHYDGPVGDQIMDGAKGVPAVFAGQYICNTALSGLHAPSLNFKDILVTVASKILTRPLIGILYPYIGDAGRDNLKLIEALFRKQRETSTLLQKAS